MTILFPLLIFYLITVVLCLVFSQNKTDTEVIYGNLFLFLGLLLLEILSLCYNMPSIIDIWIFFQIGLYFLLFQYFSIVFISKVKKLGNGILSIVTRKKCKNIEKNQNTQEIIKALLHFQQKKIGALIVFQNDDDHYAFENKGVELNALISYELILSIFYPKSTLHDGAIVINNNKIKSAGTILPLSQTKKKLGYGTRHLAALGINEKTNYPCIIISEDTQKISIALNQKLKEIKSDKELENYVELALQQS